MASLNQVNLIGRLGKDPDVRMVSGTVKKASFSLATSRFVKNGDEKSEKTEWHNIVVWKNLAELAEKFLKKGMLVFISGEITYRTWEKQDGTKAYMTEINGFVLNILERIEKKGDQNSEPCDDPDDNIQVFPTREEKKPRGRKQADPLPDSDLPF